MLASKLIDQYFALEKAIHDLVGYREEWKAIPLNDLRDYFWQVDPGERDWVRYAEAVDLLPNQAEGDYDDGDYYEDEIYTYYHLPKWVFRGEEITIVCADTNTDGNKFLHIFDNAKEVK